MRIRLWWGKGHQVVAFPVTLCIVLLRLKMAEAAIVDSHAVTRASMPALLSSVVGHVSGVAFSFACHAGVAVVRAASASPVFAASKLLACSVRVLLLLA